MLFSRGTILLTVYAYEGTGGSRKMTWWQGGGGGVWIPPKNDDLVYEQPLYREREDIPEKKTPFHLGISQNGERPPAQIDFDSYFPHLTQTLHNLESLGANITIRDILVPHH